ncbi:MAG: radical SAM family heme chaperone HemW [Bilifractor sp.]|nr:radical SAM family heme chaperone HemW [Lachnospiraceae bacterium]MDY2838472.1 radical SAM family heme chaperone HemW [Bilifractor sp.]
MELYIHIPFCAKKCGYCDFPSFPAEGKLQKRYVEALLREIRSFSGMEQRVSSIYIGGGTPSILPAECIGEILSAVGESFSVEEGAEISMEANPGTVQPGSLSLYRRAGVNRLSLGCQSADNAELKRLGRIHSFEEFRESFAYAREAGFANINVDLMSGLPGQTEDSWERSLSKIASLGPEHISAYSLIIEEGTPFYEKYHAVSGMIAGGEPDRLVQKLEEERYHLREEEQLPGEETERQMYDRTEEVLTGYGFHRYEISNYAKKGRECRHNVGYWTGTPYLGLGLGASSYTGCLRFRGTDDIGRYLKAHGDPAGNERMIELFDRVNFSPDELRDILARDGREEAECLGERDQMAEFMILGLRLVAGVSSSEFRRRFGQEMMKVYGSTIRKYEDVGLLREEGDRLILTRRGLSLSNTVMADFL